MRCPICQTLELTWKSILEKGQTNKPYPRSKIIRVYRCGKCGHVFRRVEIKEKVIVNHR